jgi:hypothetical protein
MRRAHHYQKPKRYEGNSIYDEGEIEESEPSEIFSYAPIVNKDFDTEPPNKSQFFITANTNKSYEGVDYHRAKHNLESLLERLKTEPGLWVESLKIPARGRTYKWESGETSENTMAPVEGEDVKKHINDSEFQIKIKGSGVETGKEKNRLHFHLFMQIKHRSRFHIDIPKFKDVCNRELRDIDPHFPVQISYVNVTWVPHHDTILWNYIKKDQKQNLEALEDY